MRRVPTAWYVGANLMALGWIGMVVNIVLLVLVFTPWASSRTATGPG